MKKQLLMSVVISAAVLANVNVAEAADLEAGQKVFKKCAACHTTDKGGKNKVGPNLWGMVGAGIAEKEGFKYSKAFQEKKGSVVWDRATLDEYLTKPKAFIPKTKMAFAGLKKEEDRVALLDYLETLKD